MRNNYPADMAKARALEVEIQGNDERDGEVWLHRSRVPIDEVEVDHDNLDLFDVCDSGFCFV